MTHQQPYELVFAWPEFRVIGCICMLQC